MAEIPMTVYLLTHLNPTLNSEPSFHPVEEPNGLDASMGRFGDWLQREIQPFGQAFDCGMRETEMGIQSRWIICLHTPWPTLEEQECTQIRLARGEILVGVDQIFYADSDTLYLLSNEVLQDLFLYDDEVSVPDLEIGINFRLARWARQKISGLGYNRESSVTISKEFVSTASQVPPKDWLWDDLHNILNSMINKYCDALRGAPVGWYIYERIVDEDDEEPAFLKSALIEESIEGLVADDPCGACQWLVRANPLIGACKIGEPEWESLRPVEENEVFSSRSGVAWFRECEPTWLGEIAGDLLHERHGESVEGVDELVHEYVSEIVFCRVIDSLDSNSKNESHIHEIVYDILERDQVLQICFHQIEEIVHGLVSELMNEGFSKLEE